MTALLASSAWRRLADDLHGDEVTAERILRRTAGMLDERVGRLSRTVAAADGEGAKAAALSLRTSCLMAGAPRLAMQVAELEHALATADDDAARRSLAQLVDTARRTDLAARRLLAWTAARPGRYREEPGSADANR